MPRYFNSRPREGANRSLLFHSFSFSAISIPAPARGRTKTPRLRLNTGGTIFQFPPPRGGERISVWWCYSSRKFQFPPPRGGEPLLPPSPIRRPANFNSRPREGANKRKRKPRPCCLNFNSRPREGANTYLRGVTMADKKFQFPPPRGGERGIHPLDVLLANFNSRPREGANPETLVSYTVGGISIPAPARGRTQQQ